GAILLADRAYDTNALRDACFHLSTVVTIRAAVIGLAKSDAPAICGRLGPVLGSNEAQTDGVSSSIRQVGLVPRVV
ncbi:hypothetical protein, partial [Rhizobium sp. H4]|uniref:hypothetical protein n=2 Tax=Rhizobium/Agrobacterium group TaxID=227290 RepID=UPI001AECA689